MCVYTCVCVYIYIYTYGEEQRFIGWSNNKFNNLHFRTPLETKHIAIGSRQSIDGLCYVETQVVDMTVKPIHESTPMFMAPIEKSTSQYGKLGHYAPSSSGQLFRPCGSLFLEVLFRTRLPVSAKGCFLARDRKSGVRSEPSLTFNG